MVCPELCQHCAQTCLRTMLNATSPSHHAGGVLALREVAQAAERMRTSISCLVTSLWSWSWSHTTITTLPRHYTIYSMYTIYTIYTMYTIPTTCIQPHYLYTKLRVTRVSCSCRVNKAVDSGCERQKLAGSWMRISMRCLITSLQSFISWMDRIA